jgi:hypothetical protein
MVGLLAVTPLVCFTLFRLLIDRGGSNRLWTFTRHPFPLPGKPLELASVWHTEAGSQLGSWHHGQARCG